MKNRKQKNLETDGPQATTVANTAKLKSGRSDPSMNRTFHDSAKRMQSNQILEQLNMEQSALMGMHEIYKPQIGGGQPKKKRSEKQRSSTQNK